MLGGRGWGWSYCNGRGYVKDTVVSERSAAESHGHATGRRWMGAVEVDLTRTHCGGVTADAVVDNDTARLPVRIADGDAGNAMS